MLGTQVTWHTIIEGQAADIHLGTVTACSASTHESVSMGCLGAWWNATCVDLAGTCSCAAAGSLRWVSAAAAPAAFRALQLKQIMASW
jgi:hypothetical protein